MAKKQLGVPAANPTDLTTVADISKLLPGILAALPTTQPPSATKPQLWLNGLILQIVPAVVSPADLRQSANIYFTNNIRGF